ncbi:hypothetical protein ZWY2020_049886 [Hordeum vulgare]|nr:hypothetical protein ZWY2020_049886 [Hordeum vulgare]
MSANYAAWATGTRRWPVGADVPTAVQEFSRTLFNMRPDISLHVCQRSRPTSAACWAWCTRRASSCRPPATSPSGLRHRVPQGPPRRLHHHRAPADGGPPPRQRPQPLAQVLCRALARF